MSDWSSFDQDKQLHDAWLQYLEEGILDTIKDKFMSNLTGEKERKRQQKIGNWLVQQQKKKKKKDSEQSKDDTEKPSSWSDDARVAAEFLLTSPNLEDFGNVYAGLLRIYPEEAKNNKTPTWEQIKKQIKNNAPPDDIAMMVTNFGHDENKIRRRFYDLLNAHNAKSKAQDTEPEADEEPVLTPIDQDPADQKLDPQGMPRSPVVQSALDSDATSSPKAKSADPDDFDFVKGAQDSWTEEEYEDMYGSNPAIPYANYKGNFAPELYKKAVNLVINNQNASESWLYRQMEDRENPVLWAQINAMLKQMEKDGIVSKLMSSDPDGPVSSLNQTRKVLKTKGSQPSDPGRSEKRAAKSAGSSKKSSQTPEQQKKKAAAAKKKRAQQKKARKRNRRENKDLPLKQLIKEELLRVLNEEE